MLTISLSGSTAMRNFTTSAGITEVNPNSFLSLSTVNNSGATPVINGTQLLPSDPNYWTNGGISYQFAPSSGVGSASSTRGSAADLRLEWHEQGSVEGILDMVNDQIAAVPGNAGTRSPNTANPIWINGNKFTGPGSAGTGGVFQLDNAGGAQAQSAVQMAISDVNAFQGFAVSGTAAWNATPGQAGYGQGNTLLPGGGSNNLLSLGIAKSNAQLHDQSVLNIAAGTVLHTAYSTNTTTVGVGAWNTGGTNNLESNKVAATATLFAANPGTGLDKLNRSDAQWLQTTSRFSNGASFNFTTRDTNSGTRNVAATETGVDPTWAVGVNDGGTGAAGENLIGSIKYSNKSSGGNLRTTVQNARMSLGTIGLSDALAVTQGGSSPLRGLSYSDSVDGQASNYVLASAQSIVDGSYVIWQNENYVTIKAPDGSYFNVSGTAGANIVGDTVNNDVKNFRNNVLTSANTYPSTNISSANTLSPADSLLSNGFIPLQLLQKTKNLNGIGQAVSQTSSANYNGVASADFLNNSSLTVKFAINNGQSATTITAGSGTTYNGGGTSGVAVTNANYLVGNFNQLGTRDLAALQTALAANKALEASGAGTSLFNGSSSTTVITTGVNALDTMSNQLGGIGATKGDLVVMGDFDGRGVFDGQSLYEFATGAALTDSASNNSLTPTGSETLGDAIKRGVLRKNSALDYLQTNATSQEKSEAAVTSSLNPKFTTSLAQANAFNRFDVFRDGVVDLTDAAVVDKFVGQNPADMTKQLAAVVNGNATNPAGIINPGSGAVNIPINLYNVKLLDGPGVIGNATNAAGTSDFKQIHDYINRNTGSGTSAALLNGDTQFRGTVDLQDYLTLAQNFHTTNSARWSQGDSNFDGKVDLTDYLLLAQNFHGTAGTISGSVKISAARSLSGAATPAAAPALIDPGVGNLALEVDPNTHHVYLVGNNTSVQAYNADSAGGLFNIASGKNPYETLKINPSDQASWNVLQAVPQHIAENVTTGTSSEPFAAFGSATGSYYYDLTLPGSTLWTGTESQIATDLAFDWGDGNLQHHTGQVLEVPEPTTLGLLGLGGLGLLARRRKQKTR